MTARDLIKGALRLIGVIGSGQEPSASEAADALVSLNSLISTWRTERLMVFAVTPHNFPLVAGKKNYTMGPGGDFDTVRPTRVEKVTLIYNQGSNPPLTLPVPILNIDQYDAFSVPDTTSTIPQFIYIDNEYPLRSLFLYPVPSLVNSLNIFTWEQLTQIATLDDDITLPDGYDRALRYGLAVDLAPEYGIDPLPTVVQRSIDAKASVMSLNNTYVPLMKSDAAVTDAQAGFNYLTGDSGTQGN
jgi:hypothetical protein